MAQPEDDPGTFKPGDVVDRRYTLKREIARGGTCVVHEAEQIHLGTKVALKTVLLGRGDSRRLLREGKALAKARHPHVVPVLDAGLDDVGRPYLALEMIEGRSLDGLIAARTRLGLGDALAILTQLAEALDHAHAAGVVHRDVKPSNLMISRDARGRQQVQLIDFGIASLSPGEAPEPKLTQVGDRLGTYEYMPPEQFLGEPTDARTDVYSAAATFYECIVGEVPFPGGQAAAAEAALLGKKVGSVGGLGGARATELDAVLARALSRTPAARQASVGELARAAAAAIGMAVPAISLLEPAPAATGREARRFVRAPYVTPVRILRDGQLPIDGRTEDISEGGMLLIAGTAAADGEKVQVRFSLPASGKMVTVPATTRWVRGARSQSALGLQFAELPAEAAADIRSFVAWMR